MTISAGRLLGLYQVEALIGAGGMGEVYKARDRRLDRLVAVKVLVDPLASSARRQRFEREAAAIARLTHPHICRLYEMLTHHSPFARRTSTATVAAIAAEDAPPMRTVRTDVTPALERVIARCLAKDPRQRWPDAGALLAALDVAGRIGPAKRIAAAPRRARAGPVPHRIRRLAVVPLRNISGRSDEDYLADGVTEAVMSALTQIGGLEVISRVSANRFADTGVGAAALARRIRVDAWIEGTVLKHGDHVQVAVRLMESASESQVWSGTYERARSDLGGVQSEIATHIAPEIQLKVGSAERRHAPKRAPRTAAHDAYLRARFFDPLSPAAHVNAAATLYSARQFGEAIDEARRSLDLAPRGNRSGARAPRTKPRPAIAGSPRHRQRSVVRSDSERAPLPGAAHRHRPRMTRRRSLGGRRAAAKTASKAEPAKTCFIRYDIGFRRCLEPVSKPQGTTNGLPDTPGSGETGHYGSGSG